MPGSLTQVITQLSPAWWIPGANLDLDFVNSRWFGVPDIAACLPITRSSIARSDTLDGIWNEFGAGVLRRTDKGLKIEEGRTNLFVTPLAPATQTITVVNGTVYTVSLYSAGGTLTLSGAGSGTVNANGSVTFTAGSTSLTVTCNSVTGSFQCVNVEAGSFKTSPMSVDRVVETATLINPSAYNSLTQGSIFVEWDEIPGPTGGTRQFYGNFIDSNNRIILYLGTTGRVTFNIFAGGVNVVGLASTSGVSAGNRYKAAVSWEPGRAALRVTSSLTSPANAVTGAFPTGAFIGAVGFRGDSGAQINTNIRRLALSLNAFNDNQLNALVA